MVWGEQDSHFPTFGFGGRRQVCNEGREGAGRIGWLWGLVLAPLSLCPKSGSSPGSRCGVEGQASGCLGLCALGPAPPTPPPPRAPSLSSVYTVGGPKVICMNIQVWLWGACTSFFFIFSRVSLAKAQNWVHSGQRAGMWNVNTNFRLIGTEADMDADHPQGPRNSLLPCPPPPPCCSLTSGKLAISSRVSHTALCRAFLFFHPLKGELG